MAESGITLYLEITLDEVAQLENFKNDTFQKELESRMKKVLSHLAPTRMSVSSRNLSGFSLFGLGRDQTTLLAICTVDPLPRIDAGRVVEEEK